MAEHLMASGSATGWNIMSTDIRTFRATIESLVANLASGKEKKSRKAFQALTETLGTEGTFDLLKSPTFEDELRHHALFVFASLAPPNIAVRAAWESYRSAKDAELRGRLLSKLGSLGLPASLTLPLWFFVLQDKDEDVSTIAIHEILHSFPGLAAEQLLNLRTGNPQVRLSRLRLLATLQPDLERVLDSLKLAMDGKEALSLGDELEGSGKESDVEPQNARGAVDEIQAHASIEAKNCVGTRTAEQVAMQFDSTDDLDAAIDWLWAEPELRDLPRVHVGRNTMIVPAVAVERFRKQGYHFIEQRVVSAGALPSDDINRIRREGGLPAV